MRPVWLIEAGVYGEEVEPLLAEIAGQGMVGEVIAHQALKKGSLLTINGEPLQDGSCVIGYGTFPFGRQIQLHHRWVPGAWCNPENLDCTSYFAHFGEFLLNQHCAIMPGVEAIRQQDWLFSVFGKDETVFARPTGCHKLFTGRQISKDSFSTALAPTRYDPATLVVIATPKPIGREWRQVVSGNQIVAGSQYAEDGEKLIIPGYPAEVRSFTEAMLARVRWRPDPIFMLDICESGGRLWLVEINGFSCSWLYQCDLEAVVARASELASEEWKKSQR